jgi:hypothetical protein
MIGRYVTALALVLVLGQQVMAQEDPLGGAMARDPERFLQDMTDLIAGFGGPTGLQADGIEAHIALERAGARASALRRFLVLDLDADGTVDRGELATSQSAASAGARGRMERQFLSADSDGDGRLGSAEIASAGAAAALRALGEDEAAMLRGLLRLDANGDGGLTADEVDRALQALASDT